MTAAASLPLNSKAIFLFSLLSMSAVSSWRSRGPGSREARSLHPRRMICGSTRAYQRLWLVEEKCRISPGCRMSGPGPRGGGLLDRTSRRRGAGGLSRGLLSVGSGATEGAETRAKCASTCSMVGLFVDFVFQHSFPNFQVPFPNPICSTLPGLVGRSPSTTRHTS